MDAIYLERMKHRLVNMRKVAALAHDPRIIELVTQTAEELEADILKLEAEASTPLPIESRLEGYRIGDCESAWRPAGGGIRASRDPIYIPDASGGPVTESLPPWMEADGSH